MIKNNCTTAFIYGPGGLRADDFAVLIGRIRLRAFVSPTYRSVEFQYDENGELRHSWDEASGERGPDQAAAIIRKHQGSHNGRLHWMLFPPSRARACPLSLRRPTTSRRSSASRSISTPRSI